jgi:hypothetical protein
LGLAKNLIKRKLIHDHLDQRNIENIVLKPPKIDLLLLKNPEKEDPKPKK